jgi:hypothetical protein
MVSVFPTPGDRVAPPQTQIAFRGVPVGQLGTVVVTGSQTGSHFGRLLSDSDGRGGSFLPDKSFAPGEVVTVRTEVNVRHAARGVWRFVVARPAGKLPNMPMPNAARVPGDVLSLRSRPDLIPPAVQITMSSADVGTGDVFVAPQAGPLQNGPMIVARDGKLVWFQPLPPGDEATDFRVQRYDGQPVLTWWQGQIGAGVGVGDDVIENSAYKRIAVVHAANGLSADLHEFQLTPRGTALITAYYPVYWDARAVGGSRRTIVLDSVVQEVDVKTGLVMFQWDSLDHVKLTDTYEPLPKNSGQPFDYFHVNSIEEARRGDLIISARNTWAAYDVDRDSARVVWTLGGKHSSFRLPAGGAFAFQHDVRIDADGSMVTLFDDGAGPPTVHQQSRALRLTLDRKRRSATVVGEDDHSPLLLAHWEGNAQSLTNGDLFVGWGQRPFFTQFDSDGHIAFDGRFVDANYSYRAYRFSWTAAPHTVPAIAAATRGHTTSVYASWNGATAVRSWEILGGEALGELRPILRVAKHGFETEMSVPAQSYVAVRALDVRGRVLSNSKIVQPG